MKALFLEGSLYHMLGHGLEWRDGFSIFGSFKFFGPWTITPTGGRFNIDCNQV